jgi:peptidoglycan/LPS O-acetylase OafA/YrhL
MALLQPRNSLIDALRFFAVAMVLLDHFRVDFFKNGWFGVDVFFVISGFVIAKSITGRLANHDSGRNSRTAIFCWFCIDRLARLLPLLLLCVLLGLVAVEFVEVPAEYGKHAVNGLASLFGLTNLLMQASSLDYFATGASRNVFTHLWSLGVEFQFYFLMGIILFSIKPKLANLILIVLFALSLWVWSIGSFGWSYEFSHRFWEFYIGVFCFSLTKQSVLETFNKPILLTLSFIFFCLALVAIDFKHIIGFATFGTFFVLLTVGTLDLQKNYFLSVLAIMGGASYSIYLVHWLIVWLLYMTVGIDMIINKVVGIVLSLSIGLIVYMYYESPIQRSWKSFRNNKLSAKKTLPFLVIITYFFSVLGFYSYSNAIENYSSAVMKLAISKFNSDMYTPFIFRGRVGDQPFQSDTCHYSVKTKISEDSFIENCLGLPASRDQTIYLVGDSHAAMLRHGFQKAIEGQSKNKKFVYIHNNLFNEITLDPNYNAPEFEYILENARPGDILAVTFFRGKLNKSEHLASQKKDIDWQKLAKYSTWLEANLTKIIEKDIEVALILDGPRLAINVRADVCDYRFAWSGNDVCALGSSISIADRMAQEALFEELTAKFKKVRTIDYHQELCDRKCTHRGPDGALTMLDHNHISPAASQNLSTFWTAVFKLNSI